MNSDVTDLAVTGITFPDYSLRGVRVRLALAEQSSRLARTVNGALRNLSREAFRKRILTITGNDVEFPYLADIWPGQQVTVSSIISASSSGTAISLTGLVKEFDMDLDEYDQVANWTIVIWEV